MVKFVCGFLIVMLLAFSAVSAYGGTFGMYQNKHLAEAALFFTACEALMMCCWGFSSNARRLKAMAVCFGIMLLLHFIFVLYTLYILDVAMTAREWVVMGASTLARQLLGMFIFFWLARPWRLDARNYESGSQKKSIQIGWYKE